MPRNGKAESLRLHRARRAAERAAVDKAMCDADLVLQDAYRRAVQSLVRCEDMNVVIHDLQSNMDASRKRLRDCFDGLWEED